MTTPFLRKCLCIAGLGIAVGMYCVAVPHMATAAAMATADQADGYAGQVLEKVSRTWHPPRETADSKVRIVIHIDGDGKVLRCEPVAASHSLAADKAACTAAREAGSFGVPPYGLPIAIHMSFWTGMPAPKAAPAPASDTVPAPVSAPISAPVLAPVSGSAPPQDTVTKPQKAQAVLKAPAMPVALANTTDTYVNAVMGKITPHVKLPAKLPNGKYSVLVGVTVDVYGQITQTTLVRKSGNAELDNAIMQAVNRTGKVTAPPNRDTQNLNLTFVVQKP